MRAQRRESRFGGLLWNGIHLAVLSAFAVAQPIFDILGGNPTFFAVRGSTPTEIVLFALVVTFALPIALLALELIAWLLNRTLARALHLFFVACLVAVITLRVVTKSEAVSGPAAFALAAVGGAAFALAYARVSAARSFVTILAPAPVVFLLLFLVGSPVYKLILVETPEVQAATVAAKTPVVLIVFDEFSSTSLMNRGQQIDARRFPGFASLARQSVWYRNATTVSWVSESAGPAILTGATPPPGRLPVYSDYPRNLFTLVGKNYRLKAVETLTHLCPRTLCRKTARQSRTYAVDDSARSFASDVGVLYLHLVVPKPYAEQLPSITDAWGNFTRGGEAPEQAVRRTPSGDIEPCARRVCEFTDLLTADRRPTLYFLDVSLPHVPYVYLPSGKRYSVAFRPLRGYTNDAWSDRLGALESKERYLLQLGYTDRALSFVLRKLRLAGIYDRALVIATADHGVSFAFGAPRRGPTAANLQDIAFVPLFVKLPRQRTGRIDDSFVRTIDILPTIARVLRITVPWTMEGKPLIGRRLPSDGNVSVQYLDGVRVEDSLSVLRARRSRDVLRQAATFGTGSFAAVYRVGPHREIVGRRVSSMRVRAGLGARAKITDEALLRAVEPTAEILPTYIDGLLTGTAAQTLDLAIAVNGRIEAVTRTFRQNNKTLFSAFVRERSVRAGRNVVDIFAVRRQGSAFVLTQLRSHNPVLRLRAWKGTQIIESPGAKPIYVFPRSLRGKVQATVTPSGAIFSGRAAHRNGRVGVWQIAVFVGDRAVYVGDTSRLRPQRNLGQQSLGRFGFTFELPRTLLPDPGQDTSVRVYAVRGRVASELQYATRYPWATGP